MPEKAKAEWAVNAAREIDGLYYQWFLDKLMKKDFPEPDKRVPIIEAIILKHCPEEFSEGLWAKMCVTQQAAEKLVTACKVALVFIEKTCRSAGLEPKRSLDYIIIQTALAEYKKASVSLREFRGAS